MIEWLDLKVHFREVVIDELTIAKDPDCAKSKGNEKCYPKQTFKPETIHIHPKWVSRRPTVCPAQVQEFSGRHS